MTNEKFLQKKSNRFDALFQPISLGTMRLKNRIIMSPMFTRYASESGEITDRMIKYFVARAKGGVGMIILENSCIEWDYGRGDGNPIAIHHDRFRPGLAELATQVHRHNVKILTQLHHVGRQTFCSNIDGRQPIAPSAVKVKVGGDMPRAMTEAEIEQTIQHFANAARRSKECGFDGIELHGAHGYLFSEFISPLTNLRTDKWGGSFENRCRFAVEVIRRIRKTVGPNFPLLFRFCVEEWTPGSLSLAEGVQYAQVLEKEGINALDVSGGYYETIRQFPLQGDRLDELVYLAEAVKEKVSIPVIAVGSLGWDPDVALNVIKDGKADLVNLGRELLADADLPNKLKQNKPEEIRRCIRCNECLGCLDVGWAVSCVINPECGHEYENAVQKSDSQKHIVVVGAGLAGLEYAKIASCRGHKITLLEKQDHIGGLVHIAAQTGYKKPEMSHLLKYYETVISKGNIDLQLGVAGTLEKISELKPDLVVLTLGAVPMSLPVPGAEHSKLAVAALADGAEGLGKDVCIIGGSGVGLDTALFLLEKNKNVTLLEMTDTLGAELNGNLRQHLVDMLKAGKVTTLINHRVTSITDKEVIASSNGQEVRIPCDDVLTCVGFKRIDASELGNTLVDHGFEVSLVTDSDHAGHLKDAIHSGFWAAVQL